MDGIDYNVNAALPKSYDGGSKADTVRYMDDYSPTHSIGEHSHAQGQEAVGEQVSEKLIYEGHWNYPDFAYKHDVNIYASTVYKPDDVSNSMKIENAVEYGQCDCTAQPTSIDVPATKTPDKDGAEVIEEVFCNANQSKGESEPSIAHAAAMLPSKEAARESYEVKKNEETCYVEEQSHYSHAEAKEIVEKPVEDIKEADTHGDEFTANLEELPSTTIECDVIASQEGSTGKGVSKSFSEKSIEHASISADLKVNQTPSDLPNLTARSKEEYVTTEEKTLQPQNDTAAAPSDSLTIPEKPPHSNVAESATMASETVAIRTTVASAPPTPPPRRNSILPDGLPPATPTPTMRSFHRQPSISSSRTNTMNYNYALGRLSFPTLPRNARPPRKGGSSRTFSCFLISLGILKERTTF